MEICGKFQSIRHAQARAISATFREWQKYREFPVSVCEQDVVCLVVPSTIFWRRFIAHVCASQRRNLGWWMTRRLVAHERETRGRNVARPRVDSMTNQHTHTRDCIVCGVSYWLRVASFDSLLFSVQAWCTCVTGREATARGVRPAPSTVTATRRPVCASTCWPGPTTRISAVSTSTTWVSPPTN